MPSDATELSEKPKPPPRQLPLLEPQSAFFWTSGADGKLRISRCQACARYIHPPLPACPECGGDTAPAVVSGRGRVAASTINVQAWLPGMQVPFVYAAIELEEQAELYVTSNVTDCPVTAVRRGMPVAVWFEPQEDVFLPMFKPAEVADVA